MKKNIIIPLLVALCLFTACGKKHKEAGSPVSQTPAPSTPEATEAPDAEPTEKPTEAPTPTQEPAVGEDLFDGRYTFSEISVTMYTSTKLNVRTEPSEAGEKLGSLASGTEVTVTGQCNETDWYRIVYEGGAAYVSYKYLIDPSQQASASTPSPTDAPAQTPAATAAPTQVPADTAVPTQVPADTAVPTQVPTDTTVPAQVPTVIPEPTQSAPEVPLPTIPGYAPNAGSIVLSADGTLYRSELTNEWISAEIMNQRPIAVMVDNEKIALPHYGLTEADVVYEIMNSTANGRITRFMALVKDWGKITQFGSIRSVRPTNFLLAAEWNAIICHDGGPFYIKEWVAKPYTNNLSGGFARFSNGKPTEFTEYITLNSYYNPNKDRTYSGLIQRIAAAKYSTTYNSYYTGTHFLFSAAGTNFSGRADAISATYVSLPFPHNQSTLTYNAATKTYDYSEYGKAHLDPLHNNAQLTFTNVIIQNTDFVQLDANGYLIYDVISSGKSGYYLTEGKAIPVFWVKPSETGRTVYYELATGAEIQLNTGKTYISLVPSDSWDNVVIR